MDKSKKIIIALVIVIMLCAGAVRWCIKTAEGIVDWIMPLVSLSYEHADLYTADTVGCSATEINEIEIEWINGSVEVKYADVENVSWKETYDFGDITEENMLHYWENDGRLYLRYCAPHYEDHGNWRWVLKENKRGQISKDLTVLLPINRHYDRITMKTVNGALTIHVPETLPFEAKVDKVNGTVYTEMPCTQEYNMYRWGENPQVKLSMILINGSVNILKL